MAPTAAPVVSHGIPSPTAKPKLSGQDAKMPYQASPPSVNRNTPNIRMIRTPHIPSFQSIQQAQVDSGRLNGFIGARGVADEAHTKRMGVVWH